MGWIDLVMERRSAARLCEAVAASGCFQPDVSGDDAFGSWNLESTSRSALAGLRTALRPFADSLPRPDFGDTTIEERSAGFESVRDDIEGRLKKWLEAVAADRRSLAECDASRDSLARLKCALDLLPDTLRLELWRTAGETRLFVPVVLIGERQSAEVFIAGAGGKGMRSYPDAQDGSAVVISVVPEAGVKEFLATARRLHLEQVDVPPWLSGTPVEAGAAVDAAVARVEEEARRIRERIREHSARYRIGGALWCIERQNWLEGVLDKANRGAQFVRIGGWVPKHLYRHFVDRLRRSGEPFLVRMEDSRSHGASPSLLSNPRWIRKFELFVNGFGTPDADEVDPSAVLAVITPLMFGYMFGDVGQGLLLVVLGLLFRRKLPWTELLIPAGASSMLFGVLYGSVFSIEHLLPALWVHPMEHPLLMLGAPLLFGAALMFLSLFFGFVKARWRGEGREWLWDHLPLMLCYVAAPTAFLSLPTAGILAAVSIAMVIVRPARRARSPLARLAHLPGTLLELLEQWLQLLINTLSFTRLGAFALAHAGLGIALTSLAELPGSWFGSFLVLCAGNIVITALEGLVVSIQTTRLVMFEFYRRFFEGAGRRFQPLTLSGHPDAGDVETGASTRVPVKPQIEPST